MQPPPWAKPYSYGAFYDGNESDSSSSDSDSSENQKKDEKMLGFHCGELPLGGVVPNAQALQGLISGYNFILISL